MINQPSSYPGIAIYREVIKVSNSKNCVWVITPKHGRFFGHLPWVQLTANQSSIATSTSLRFELVFITPCSNLKSTKVVKVTTKLVCTLTISLWDEWPESAMVSVCVTQTRHLRIKDSHDSLGMFPIASKMSCNTRGWDECCLIVWPLLSLANRQLIASVNELLAHGDTRG